MGRSLASGVDPVVIAAPSRGSKKVPIAIRDPRDGSAALLSLALGCPGITLSLAPAHFFQCLFHTVFHGINVVLSEAMYPVHKALRVTFFRPMCRTNSVHAPKRMTRIQASMALCRSIRRWVIGAGCRSRTDECGCSRSADDSRRRTNGAKRSAGMFSGLLRIRFGGDTSTLDASVREWHRHP